MNKIASVLPGFLGLFLASFCPATRVLAQIEKDSTLGAEFSDIKTDGNLIKITGGAERGTNLFHSFDKFNVPVNNIADFQPKSAIKVIFSRVTGSEPSIILGTLKVTGNANLFLMNPRGIVFGKGASLDINGAFVATTANTIKFPDGTQFSTIDPQGVPLLTVETPPPIGLELVGLEFVGGSPSAIINAGTLSTTNSNSNIALVGGTILSTGTIYTKAANINLITVSGGTNVDLDNSGNFQSSKIVPIDTQANSGLSILDLLDFNYDRQHPEKSIKELIGLSINNQNQVIFSDSKTTIPVTDGDITFALSNPGDNNINLFTGYDSFAEDPANAPGNGGNLIINSQININLLNYTISSLYNSDVDDDINLIARKDIELINSNIKNLESNSDINLTAENIFLKSNLSTSIENSSFSAGETGNINLTASSQISLIGGAEIVSKNDFPPDYLPSGDIILSAPNIILTSSNPKAPTGIRSGESGKIELKGENIELTNFLIQNESSSTQNNGEIVLEFKTLTLNNSDISTNVVSGITKPVRVSKITVIPDPRYTNVLDSQINLMYGSSIAARSTFGNTDGGNIKIKAGTLGLYGGSIIIASNAGDVNIETEKDVIVNNSSLAVNGFNISNGSAFTSRTLSLNTNALTLENGGNISAEISTSDSSFEPSAGNIKIEVNSLDLNHYSQINANAIGSGDSGQIYIKATDYATLDNYSKITSMVTPKSLGNSGKIDITTPILTLTNHSLISTEVQAGSTANKPSDIEIKVANLDLNESNITASTSGNGDAGRITVDASEHINLQNSSSISTKVESTANGQGGKIEISAMDVNIGTNSQITTTTESTKNAGDIILSVSNLINLDGSGSGLFANTGENSTGNGGTISIDPEVFIIQNSAGIFVDSKGTGTGGNIEISAGNLTLNNGKISAETFSNNGGNISLDIGGLFLLRNTGRISATAGKGTNGGNGGNITIDSGFLITKYNEDSDILANAFTGNGGNINIQSNGIFGFRIQDNFRLSPETGSFENPSIDISEIVASSQFGAQGIININTLQIDPIAALQSLPESTINVKVSQGCNPRLDKAKTAFFELGKTGLPNNPDLLFSAEVVPSWTLWSNSHLDIQSELETQKNDTDIALSTSASNNANIDLPCQQND